MGPDPRPHLRHTGTQTHLRSNQARTGARCPAPPHLEHPPLPPAAPASPLGPAAPGSPGQPRRMLSLSEPSSPSSFTSAEKHTSRQCVRPARGHLPPWRPRALADLCGRCHLPLLRARPSSPLPTPVCRRAGRWCRAGPGRGVLPARGEPSSPGRMSLDVSPRPLGFWPGLRRENRNQALGRSGLDTCELPKR